MEPDANRGLDTFIAALKAAYSDSAISEAVENYHQACAGAPLSPSVLSKAICTCSSCNRGRMLGHFSRLFAGPFSSAVHASVMEEAAETLYSSYQKEEVVLVLASHVSDPEAYESTVVDVHTPNISGYTKDKIKAELAKN